MAKTLFHGLEILSRVRGNTFTPNVFVGIYQLKLYILELDIYQLKYLTLITITNQVRHLKINSTLSMSGKDRHYSCFNRFRVFLFSGHYLRFLIKAVKLLSLKHSGLWDFVYCTLDTNLNLFLCLRIRSPYGTCHRYCHLKDHPQHMREDKMRKCRVCIGEGRNQSPFPTIRCRFAWKSDKIESDKEKSSPRWHSTFDSESQKNGVNYIKQSCCLEDTMVGAILGVYIQL